MSKQHFVERKLIHALLNGRWKLFDRLPAERVLAEEFGVNRTTLRSAIISLAAKGMLETRHGSGTVVRALPHESVIEEGLGEKLDACIILIPSVMKACSLKIRPSQLLAMERLFLLAGAALNGSDMPAFVRAQMQFFSDAVQVAGNSCIDTALAVCMPDSKSIIHLLEMCGGPGRETLFSRFADMLNALRHCDAEETVAASAAYCTCLKDLWEKA